MDKSISFIFITFVNLFSYVGELMSHLMCPAVVKKCILRMSSKETGR